MFFFSHIAQIYTTLSISYCSKALAQECARVSESKKNVLRSGSNPLKVQIWPGVQLLGTPDLAYCAC